MGMSKLNIWVRDAVHPCLPYQSTGHNWVAVIVTCDLQPLFYGAVKNGLYPLTDRGKAGGKVHGQVEVPPGCYIVVGFSTCKNVLTDWALVQAGCDEEVCVNLITKTLSRCTGELLYALQIAQYLGLGYTPSSPAGRPIPGEVVSKAIATLEELRKHLPEDTVLPKLPISLDSLKKMAEEEKKGRRG